MVDGEHGGGDEPRRADERADGDLDGDEQQVQVVAAAFLLLHAATTTAIINTFNRRDALVKCTCLGY